MGPLGEVLKKPLLWGISANVVGVVKSEINKEPGGSLVDVY